jgi:hypothetical protein
MTELEKLYAELLHRGFIVLREAFDSGSLEWLNAEIELLHNVPSLMGENNEKRHQYFWSQERTYYLERLSKLALERAQLRIRMLYEPIWAEMEPLIAQLLARAGVGEPSDPGPAHG